MAFDQITFEITKEGYPDNRILILDSSAWLMPQKNKRYMLIAENNFSGIPQNGDQHGVVSRTVEYAQRAGSGVRQIRVMHGSISLKFDQNITINQAVRWAEQITSRMPLN